MEKRIAYSAGLSDRCSGTCFRPQILANSTLHLFFLLPLGSPNPPAIYDTRYLIDIYLKYLCVLHLIHTYTCLHKSFRGSSKLSRCNGETASGRKLCPRIYTYLLLCTVPRVLSVFAGLYNIHKYTYIYRNMLRVWRESPIVRSGPLCAFSCITYFTHERDCRVRHGAFVVVCFAPRRDIRTLYTVNGVRDLEEPS